MSIQRLSEEVASAIAAGEVIERPSSVVKELIENSLDADSNHIAITIEEGGHKRIEVTDDGIGISATDLPLSIERYATSKLSTIDDLQNIQTLGFRGEALSSIGAVAHLIITSRVDGEDTGAALQVDGGKVQPPRKAGCPVGTSVEVNDLFFNVPARKEFQKTATTEKRRITTLVSRYAFAYPDRAFSLIHNDRQVFQTSGNGNSQEVLAAILGTETARGMIPLQPGEGQIAAEGWISTPTVHRSSRRDLVFFVNGRWVQDTSLPAAVLQAYHSLLMVGRYPIVFIKLEMPPDAVDVNVHPAKTEVRFRSPDRIFSTVQRAVRATLLGQSPIPPSETSSMWTVGPLDRESEVWDPSWRAAMMTGQGVGKGAEPLQPALPAVEIPILRPVGQVGSTYIVAEGPDGVYLIDQHAAHERILFERMSADRAEGSLEVQRLLEPRVVECSPEEDQLVQEYLEVLQRLGFEIEGFGTRTYQIRSVPAITSQVDAESVFRSALRNIEEDESPFAEELESRLIARVCKRAAIRAGQLLSLEEQRQLVRDLERCTVPRTCPHGRPTMIHISVDSLERQFGRRG